MATLSPAMKETVERVFGLLSVNAAPVDIGNAVRDAAGGDALSAALTAASTIETFVSLAKVELASKVGTTALERAGGVLAVGIII
ncbi:MAG: hypothetical protein ED859_18190 [Desulfuromonadales bacterium]|nr:MAG: hypothetical protein ED859_18190 [Desulfuromonadales bacterium]